MYTIIKKQENICLIKTYRFKAEYNPLPHQKKKKMVLVLGFQIGACFGSYATLEDLEPLQGLDKCSKSHIP